MISSKMQAAINDQIQAEFFSAYMYLAMSVYYSDQNLPGIAHWLRVQYEEETEHAEKLIDYLVERGGVVELKAIQAPDKKYGSVLQTFEKVLAHEKLVTSLIHKLYELAVKEKDYASQVFLQWFISEQVEEEANADEIVQQAKRIPENSAALFYFDKKLGKRED